MPVKPEILETLHDAAIQGKVMVRARSLLQSVGNELFNAHWYREDWLQDVLHRIPQEFDRTLAVSYVKHLEANPPYTNAH